MSRLAYRAYSERLDRQADAMAVLPGGAPRSKPARCSYVEEFEDGTRLLCLTVVALSVEGRPLCREHASEALDFEAIS